MSALWHLRGDYGKSMLFPVLLSGLVLSTTASLADTAVPATGEAVPGNSSLNSEVSFWVDAAPLDLVIRQLASLSGRTAEIEEIAAVGELVEGDNLVETEKVAKSKGFAEVLVSGRFSGSLGGTLAKLSADYPVTFDLDGKTLRATNGAARSSVSIAMLNTPFDESFKSELLANSVAGNSVEFREDAVRLSGHPAFVKRQAGYITRLRAAAEATPDTDALMTTADSAPAAVTSVADSGSAEVLVDIQDEGRLPAEQANLSKPIRWVTDIPGFHTF